MLLSQLHFLSTRATFQGSVLTQYRDNTAKRFDRTTYHPARPLTSLHTQHHTRSHKEQRSRAAPPIRPSVLLLAESKLPDGPHLCFRRSGSVLRVVRRVGAR